MSKYVEAANWVSEQRQAKNIFQNFNKMFNLESFEDAYLVQDSLETVWAHKGDVIGYKLALTSKACLLYTSPSPRDRTRSRMPSSA